MRLPRKLIVPPVVLVLGLTLVRGETQGPITGVSTNSFFGGELTVRVFATNKDVFRYEVVRTTAGPIGESFPVAAHLMANAGWMIYPITPDTVWVFVGKEPLLLFHFNATTKQWDVERSDEDPDLPSRAPNEFKLRFPQKNG
jgi:hypothetical protein